MWEFTCAIFVIAVAVVLRVVVGDYFSSESWNMGMGLWEKEGQGVVLQTIALLPLHIKITNVRHKRLQFDLNLHPFLPALASVLLFLCVVDLELLLLCSYFTFDYKQWLRS